MRVPILMPQLGESIAEATVRDIKIKVGQSCLNQLDVLLNIGDSELFAIVSHSWTDPLFFPVRYHTPE